ncbi:MAG: VWA domain-containing protein [Planctomycetaceae bacterium]|nr:VWA domain-containing protein [Planctomycetaceae bacterium]
MTTRNYSSFGVSLVLHSAILVALGLIKYQIERTQEQTVLDTVFTEERQQEEFEQTVDTNTDVAETMNFVASNESANTISISSGGGTGGSGAGGGTTQAKIDGSESLKEPGFAFRPGPITVPGLNVLGNDLGAGQVTGDIGRVVEGYGAALSQVTQELVRLMREEKILACWMFDASESMEDDRKEMRDNFHKVYEELGLVSRADEKLKTADEPILTSIFSFNTGAKEHTTKPTSDIAAIRAAIDKITKDEGGDEKFCTAAAEVVQKYQRMAAGQKRRLVLIMVSDESGDDGDKIEETIDVCKRGNVPVYFMGRYAVFGFPYATMIWKDPKYGLTHWLRIKRGPETPFPEALQFDGLHERWDVYSSGFGPYEQVRLCRETGGIFFLLPGDETNISGRGSNLDRKYEMLDMKEYLPNLNARLVYQKERDSSKFRNTIFQVVQRVNPFLDEGLRMREHHFPIEVDAFAKEGAVNFTKAVRALKLLNEAVAFLETVAPGRDKEPSERWRAHYDLAHAQLLAYRVRLFQYILNLDAIQKNKPKANDPKSNQWHMVRTPKMLPPDPVQVKQAGVDLKELEAQEKQAREEFQAVVKNHPRTPWAQLAQQELAVGFGMTFREHYHDPRYDRVGKDIKLPNP